MTNPSLPFDDLLQHADWVRGLARSLVRDAARADDVAQEVWLAAIRSGPEDDRNLRGWLRTTARRIAGVGREREAGARQREKTAARGEALPATDELVTRAAVQRHVSELVVGLDEPYRRVLLLRYWEDLAPREIAEREGLPIATVKTRLQRGQARLRERLEKEYGGEGRWCLALAPLLPGKGLREAGAGTVSATSAGMIVAGSALGLVALAFGTFQLLPEEPSTTPRAEQEIDAALHRGTGTTWSRDPGVRALEPGQRSARIGDRSGLAATANDPVGTLAATPARLVDADGNALGDLLLREPGPHTVRWQGGDPVWIGNDVTTLRLSLEEQERLRGDRAALADLCNEQEHAEEWSATLLGGSVEERESRSGPEGEVNAGSDVEVVEPGWTLVAAGTGRGTEQRLLVGSPAVRLAGVVVDLKGRPVRRASVTFVAPELPQLGTITRRGGPPACTTDRQGRFVLRDVPSMDGASVRVRSDRHETWIGPVPTRDDATLRIELEPLDVRTPRIEGVVLDENGRPLPDARIHFGALRSGVASDGAFELPVPGAAGDQRLLVWAPGLAPFVDEEAGKELAASTDRRLLRRVVLDRGAREIRGRVVDPTGVPLGGVRIGLLDASVLDGTLSSLAARIDGRELTVETDEAGGFALGGLEVERAQLRLFDPATGRMQITRALASDAAEVELVLRAVARTVSGQVSWPAGKTPESVSVQAGFDWLTTEDGEGAIFETGLRVEPDAEGFFRLENVPERGAWIEVRLDGTARRFPVESLDLERPLSLVLD